MTCGCLSVDFGNYYTYEELTEILEKLCSEYPDFAELNSLGKSYEGRDIWFVAVTNQKTGAPEDKPAYYIDGNHHAGEVTGSMVALYTVVYLLENHSSDRFVQWLLNNITFYIVPRISPDGAERFLTTADLLRSSVRPWPARNDAEYRQGLKPKDVDQNGVILQMRIENETGAWAISQEDERLMVLREPHDDGPFYDLYPEGINPDEDTDVVSGVSSEWGLDLNRNYPYGWVTENDQSGAGPYPLSEPETYSVARFFSENDNIAGVTSYHTYGGIILRPLCTQPDSEMDLGDLQIHQFLGDIATRFTGYSCESVYEAMTLDKKSPARGSFIDYVYHVHGLLAFAPELWDWSQRAQIYSKGPMQRWLMSAKEREKDDLKLLRWIDENCPESFHEWRQFEHPQFGMVEIGGIDIKYVKQNPPAEYLENECHKNMRATLINAASLPRLRITEAEPEELAPGLYRLSVVVENRGWLGTYVTSKGRDPDQKPHFQLDVTEKASVRFGETSGRIGHLDGASAALHSSVPKRREKLSWMIRCDEADVEFKLKVTAPRSGSEIYLINTDDIPSVEECS